MLYRRDPPVGDGVRGRHDIGRKSPREGPWHIHLSLGVHARPAHLLSKSSDGSSVHRIGANASTTQIRIHGSPSTNLKRLPFPSHSVSSLSASISPIIFSNLSLSTHSHRVACRTELDHKSSATSGKRPAIHPPERSRSRCARDRHTRYSGPLLRAVNPGPPATLPVRPLPSECTGCGAGSGISQGLFFHINVVARSGSVAMPS